MLYSASYGDVLDYMLCTDLYCQNNWIVCLQADWDFLSTIKVTSIVK